MLSLSYALVRRYPAFAAVARILGSLVTLSFAYALSFHDVAREMGIPWDSRAWSLAVFPQLAALAACLGLVARTRAGDLRARPFAALLLAASALVLGGALLPEPELPLTVFANLALCIPAAYGLAVSLHALERRAYWASVGLLLLVIVSRFLEYETGLLAKAAVFTACGIAVLLLGIGIERRARARESAGA
jgi:hypothetical protein